MSKNKRAVIKNYGKTTGAVILAALIQVYAIQVFAEPANLLPSGFNGISMLLNQSGKLLGVNIPVSFYIVLLNIPAAFLCIKRITKKFAVFSLAEIFLMSIFLETFRFEPIFDDILLNLIFGGVIYGLGTVIALKGNASTGGMDFIALYASDKCGKSIWEYVFVMNCIVLAIFGYLFEWSYAGYSILFQFVSTKMISAFHRRYERVTLQVTTQKGDEIIEAYIAAYKHGLSKLEAIGGYSKARMQVLHTVVSSYEVNDIIQLMKKIDNDIIVNIMRTEGFHGNFYRKPMD